MADAPNAAGAGLGRASTSPASRHAGHPRIPNRIYNGTRSSINTQLTSSTSRS